MREAEKIIQTDLTKIPKPPYAKGGDIFMAEPGSGEGQPQKPQAENQASQAKRDTARQAWEKNYGGQLPNEVGERRVIEALIKEGVLPVAGGAQNNVNKTGIPAIDAEIDAMNNILDTGLRPPLSVYLEAMTSISKLASVDDGEKQVAIDEIKQAIRNAYEESERNRPAEEQERRYSLYFTPAEQEALRKDPTEWLDTQFDVLYRFAEEGQELSSPIINGVQQQVSQAVDFVKNYRPEIMSEFLTQYTVRLHLLQTRTAIGYRSMENVKQAAHELRFHGLMTGMTLEKGMVGAMFNRLQCLLEDIRLPSNKRHHVMLEDAYQLQKMLIDEQMALAKKGIGSFGDLSDIKSIDAKNQNPNDRDTWDDFRWAEEMTDKEIKENEKISEEQRKRILKIKSVNARITRSVRTAYDVFVCSQRMGVVVSRGKYLLKDASRYRSDPIGPLNVYNMEELLFEKFDMYNPAQEEMVDRIRLDMAEGYLKKHPEEKLDREQKLNLGKRLFRDIFAVPDFFSSGWRIEGVIQALEQRFESSALQGKKPLNQLFSQEELKEYESLPDIEKKKFAAKKMAKDFALFMRLKIAKEKKDPDSKEECREDVWGKIREFRPEEIIRLFRERKNSRLVNLYSGMTAIDFGLGITDEEKFANRPEDEGGRGKDITVYDKFKEKYGAAIGLLRQEGFNRRDGNGNQFPTQINLSELDNGQKEIVNKFLGDDKGAEKLINLATVMKNFISKEGLIGDLLADNNFADIYTRSIIIDDALLDKLEDEKVKSAENLGYAPLSKIIGEAGAGGDTLVRSWNDTENAAKGGNALIQFIKTEDLEQKTGKALEFAASAANYNGLGAKGQAECVRYTIGTYLNLSKLDMAWDIIGLHSLPFRLPASDAQRIFGVQANALGRDELRVSLDKLRGFLNSSVTMDREELREKKKEIAEKGLSEKDKKETEKKLPGDYREKAKEVGLSEDEFIKNKFIEGLEAKLTKDEEDSAKFYEDMEGLLEVTGRDFFKRAGLRFLLYLILAVGGETVRAGKSAIDTKQ